MATTESGLEALLTVQELDLEADRLRARREELAGSKELEQCAAEVEELDRTLTESREKREELARAEHALGVEVEGVASKAEEVEARLYSGSVTIPKELEALQQDLQMLRRRQTELEDLELEQLEAIESVEGELAGHDARRSEATAHATEVEAAIRTGEAEIAAELTRIEAPRSKAAKTLPGPVLEAYDRLRRDRRLAGRAAALLGDGICEGCHTQLPTREYSRIRGEPPESVVTCINCSRLLVR